MTPESSTQVTSKDQSTLDVPPLVSREPLVKQLAAELEKLEPLCLPPPTIQRQSFMHFRHDEFEDVQATLEREGMQAVIARWSDRRAFARRNPHPLANLPTSPTSDQRYPLLLSVTEFIPDPSPNPAQSSYFRSCSFQLSEPFQNEIRSMLDDSGMRERFWPGVDSVTHASLADASVEHIECSAQWYGPENIYGKGTVLLLTLSLRPPEHDEIYLRLSLDRCGILTRSVWAAELVETGYEGHDHMAAQLSADELRGFLPIITQLQTLNPEPPLQCTTGTWVTDSFLSID
jgi:hypothetical protein